MPLFNNQYNWWDYPQLNQQGLRSMLFQQQPELPQQAVIPPQQPIYSEMKVPQIPLRPEIPDNYQNYWDFPSGLFQYRKDVISPNHPIYGEESPTQSDMAGIEPYNIKEDPLIANLPTPQETTPDPYQFGLSPQDNKNSLIQALLGFGMGTLAANKPGVTAGQAIGQGGLTGLQQYGTATQSALKQNLERYQAQKLAEQMALAQKQETRKSLIESANLGLAMKKDLREEKALQPALDEKVANTEAKTATTQNLTTPIGEANAAYASKQLGYTVDPQMTYDQANKLGIKFTPEKPEKNAIKVVVDKTSPTGYSYQDLLSGQTYPNAPAPKEGTTVNVNTDKKFLGSIADKLGEDIVATKQAAVEATKTITAAHQIKSAIEEGGIILGPTATLRTKGAQIAQMLKFTGDNAVAQTRNAIQGVAKLALGARQSLKGQGQISDMETKLLQKAESVDGLENLTLPELAIIADIAERGARLTIKRNQINKVKLSKYEGGSEMADFLTVEEPPPFTKPKRAKTVVERRVTASGKKLVKYSDGSIGEE